MSKDIYIDTGDLSSRLLKKTSSALENASEKLTSINSCPMYQSPTGYEAIFPSYVISDIINLKNSIDNLQNKTDAYAKLIENEPDALCDIDAKCKNDITSWWSRAEYTISNSFFGTTLSAAGNLVVDVYAGITDAVGNVYNFVVDKVEYGRDVLRTKASQIVSDIKESYENHGFVYDFVEYGKCTVKAAFGVASIVTGAVEIATGGGIPLGVISIMSGINSISTAAADATYIKCDAYELVGQTNWLQDTLSENGEQIGELIGNPEAGKRFGELTYVGFEMVDLLGSAEELLEKFGTANTMVTGTTGYSFCWGWTSFDDYVYKTDAKVAWDAIYGTIDILGDSWDFGTLIAPGQ